jgi:anti-sigma-K factor RskA
MNCEVRRDMMLLEAAGALNAAELAELRAHLATGCPRCLGAQAEARAVLAHLSLGLPPVTPTPEAKERLMSRVHADVATRSAPTPQAADPKATAPVPSAFSSPPYRSSSASQAETAHNWRVLWLRPIVTAALASAATLVVGVLPAWRQAASLRDALAQQTQRTTELHDQLASQAVKLTRLETQLNEAATTVGLLRSPRLLLADLRGGAQPKANGRVLWDRDNATWHFFASNLTPAGPGKTYELWFITASKKKIRAGVFDADQTGGAHLVVPIPAGIGPIALAAVTDEPAGGVDQPTGQIQLAGALPTRQT